MIEASATTHEINIRRDAHRVTWMTVLVTNNNLWRKKKSFDFRKDINVYDEVASRVW